METGIIFDRNTGHVKAKNPTVTVSKSGVVLIRSFYDKEIMVNSESMITLIDNAIDELKNKPELHVTGLFAGRVTITVEFLGDMDEKMMTLAERLEVAGNEEDTDTV